MRYYVEAYRADGSQILGNLDGQRAWSGRDFRRAAWFKRLANTRTLGDRVAYWRVVDSAGTLCATVRPMVTPMTLNHTPTPYSRNIPPAVKYPMVYAGRNTHIFHMTTTGRAPEQVEADLEFILRACNAHEALVRALETIALHAPSLNAIGIRELCDEALARVTGNHENE